VEEDGYNFGKQLVQKIIVSRGKHRPDGYAIRADCDILQADSVCKIIGASDMK
jgi:hypothetical protein